MRLVERCPACDGAQTRVVVRADASAMVRYLAYSARKYGGLLDDWVNTDTLTILCCETCDHHWYRNQPTAEQLSAMYAAGRPLHGPASPSREPTPAMLKEMRRLYRLAGGGAPSLLDYGSGFGRWARAAVQAGFRVHAFEPSAARGAEPDAPFTLVHELDALRDMTFDVIHLEQVLEHVPSPLETLEQIKTYCSPETILRITAPTILRPPEGSGIWEVWPYDGKRAHTMAPFEHLHGFTPSSLIKLVKRSGYKVLPLEMLWRYYPILSMRNLVSHVYPKAGQTMVLAKIKNQRPPMESQL